MICPFCNSPIMFAPALGSYCSNLECHSNKKAIEPYKRQIEKYEMMRRKRDGMAHGDMPEPARIKMLQASIRDCERAEQLWRAIRK